MPRGGARNGAGRPAGINTSWSRESVDRFRSLIQTKSIIQRLNDLAAGRAEMPPHAVTAALGLLRKVMPDTAAVEHSGEITTTKVIRAPALTPTVSDWTEQHVPKAFTEH